MEPILKSILENKTENYLLPFFWQHDGHDAKIPARVQKIYESGCRAFCVESRPYEHFCEDAWWKDDGHYFGGSRKARHARVDSRR